MSLRLRGGVGSSGFGGDGGDDGVNLGGRVGDALGGLGGF
jgi:hypothetical protein